MWNCKRLFLIFLVLFGSSGCLAAHLPSEDSIKGVMVVCGGGRQRSFEGDIHAKIELWKRQAGASGKASLSDLSALFATVPKGQQVNDKAYQTYTKCVLDLMKQYVMLDHQPNKATRLIAGASLGYYLNMLMASLPAGMVTNTTPKIPNTTYEYPFGGLIDGAERAARQAGAPPCPMRGQPETFETPTKCMNMYATKVRDEEFQGFLKLGVALAEVETDSDRGDRYTYPSAKSRLVEACKQMNVSKAIASIPPYTGTFNDVASRTFLAAVAEETRKNYPTTYSQ